MALLVRVFVTHTSVKRQDSKRSFVYKSERSLVDIVEAPEELFIAFASKTREETVDPPGTEQIASAVISGYGYALACCGQSL